MGPSKEASKQVSKEAGKPGVTTIATHLARPKLGQYLLALLSDHLSMQTSLGRSFGPG